MSISIREISIAVGITGSLLWLFSRAPDFNQSHVWERQYVVEDRKYSDDKRKAALVELRTCYQGAEATYISMWSKSCRTVNDHHLNECFASGVPENACRSKFVFNEECELPSYRAERNDSNRESLKTECRTLFMLEMGDSK